MPHSRLMPSIGKRCHEIRARDAKALWRIVYRIDPDAIVLAGVLDKDTSKTPKSFIAICQARLMAYDNVIKGNQQRG